MPAQVTLKTISQVTGYSVTTVSRALTNYDDVAPETREKIHEAARKLGYYPNITARQLKKQRTDTIGLILPTYGPRLNDPYFSELIAGIGDELVDFNYDLLLSTRSPGSEELAAYRYMVEGKRVDGLIVVRTRKQDERIKYLNETQLPFVAFGRSDLEFDFPYIDEDGEAGFTQLTEYILSLGHQKIAFISAPMELIFANYRLQGYCKAMQNAGVTINPDYIIEGDLTRRGGENAARKLLSMPDRPTAIIAANDLMAMSVISVAREFGLVVGKDISIAGFDDVLPADIFSLTTLRQPIYDIGRLLSSMLFRFINQEPVEERHLLLKPKIIIRNSTGSPPTNEEIS